MTDVLLSLEDNSPEALQAFAGVVRWVMYRTNNIWVGAPRFRDDKQVVIADVMFPDPSSPEDETGMWFSMNTSELLNGEFWTLVMQAQAQLEDMREQYADWSKPQPAILFKAGDLPANPPSGEIAQ